MNIRPASLIFAASFAALTQTLFAAPTNHWRGFKKADGLPENNCLSLTIGATGNILVRHAKSSAITLFDGYTLTTIPGPGTNRSRVYESPGGQLWTVAPEGLQEFREGEWTRHPVPDVAEHFRSRRTNEIVLLPYRQGRVLILLPDRLLQLNAEDPERSHVELLRRAEASGLGTFSGLIPSRDEGVWVSGASGFARIPGPLRSLKPDDPWTTSVAVPAELQNLRTNKASSDDLSVRRINDAATDKEGALWVATSDGLFRRAPELWEAERRSPDAVNSTVVRRADSEVGALPALPDEIAQRGKWKSFHHSRNGDLWLGAINEIAWRHQNSWKFFSSTNQIGPEEVLAFAEAPDGRLWCATPDKVWEFNGKDWLAIRGGFDSINALLGSRDGTLWVATSHGVQRFTQGLWIVNDVADGLLSEDVRGIAESQPGQLQADTARGSCRFNPQADTDAPTTYIYPAPAPEPSFREGSIVAFTIHGRDRWNQTTPERLLFSFRLDEGEWSVFQPMREISFPDLALGKHYFQVRALDRNGNIDPKPARLAFTIIVPWYRETRLVLILMLALGVAVFFGGLAFNRHRKLQHSYAEVEQQIAARTRELELANRELIHSQKMNALGTLSAGIAHDFNNILSIIKGSAQIIEDNAANPEKIRTRVARIQTVVQQGAEVVEAMLGFSRSTDAPPVPCDINAVVGETKKLLGDRFLRETEVRFERGENLPELSVAKDFVQQILLNFIFNAAEAMERRSPDRLDADRAIRQRADQEIGAPSGLRKQITITTRVTEQLPPELFLAPASAPVFVLISVRDTGSGIAPEIKARIFEPFFTTKALSTKRGTGLGLSMVYELAKKLEAGLAVESTVGAGSTFTLVLPVKVNVVKFATLQES